MKAAAFRALLPVFHSNSIALPSRFHPCICVPGCPAGPRCRGLGTRALQQPIASRRIGNCYPSAGPVVAVAALSELRWVEARKGGQGGWQGGWKSGEARVRGFSRQDELAREFPSPSGSAMRTKESTPNTTISSRSGSVSRLNANVGGCHEFRCSWRCMSTEHNNMASAARSVAQKEKGANLTRTHLKTSPSAGAAQAPQTRGLFFSRRHQ